jgi:hypothetical protein
MGAALTYARRYALFTLVGIAGEDDLDAPARTENSAGETTGIDPLKIARKLWKKTRLNGLAGRVPPLPRAASTDTGTAGEPQPVSTDLSPSGGEPQPVGPARSLSGPSLGSSQRPCLTAAEPEPRSRLQFAARQVPRDPHSGLANHCRAPAAR